MKELILTISITFYFIVSLTGQNNANDSLKYLNQDRPGLIPEVFAPGIISKGDEYEFGSVFSEKADKFYFGIRLNEDWKAEIRYTELKNNKWIKPKKLNLDSTYGYNDPFLSSKEDKLFFVSNRAIDGKGVSKDFDIWYIQKTDSGWEEPVNAGEVINSEKDEFYISITNTGSIYFASNVGTTDENKWDFDIYRSKLVDGKYQKPKNLGDSINSKYFECDAFVSPDETYMIFCSSRPGGYGEGDLYISFKTNEDKWTKAKNMGETLNTNTHEFCPQVTKDGKYLFYTSNADIYWVDAKIIEKIRKKLTN